MDPRIKDILIAAGAPDAEIKAIRLHRADKVLEVALSCPRLLSCAEKQAVTCGFAALMPECSVQLSLDYGDTAKLLETDFAASAEVLKADWCSFAPLLRPALINSVWSLENGGITLHVPEKLEESVTANGSIRAFEARLQEQFGLSVRLRVTGDAALQAPQLEELRRAEPQPKAKKVKPSDEEAGDVIMGRVINRARVIKQAELNEQLGSVTIAGAILSLKIKPRSSGEGNITEVVITDRTGTTPVKLFLKPQETVISERLQRCKDEDKQLVVNGRYTMDPWLKRMCVYPNSIMALPIEQRQDTAEQKRVELHLHTQMSSMDALVKPADAVKTAARWGHAAVAITDHGVVQAFPAAINAANKLKKSGKDIKVILGMEGYLLPDCTELSTDAEFTALGVVTAPGHKLPAVYRIYAVHFTKDGVGERLSLVVDPGIPMSKELREKLGDPDAEGMPLKEALFCLTQFIRGNIVIYQPEQLSVLRQYCERFGLELDRHCVSLSLLCGYLNREAEIETLEEALEAEGIDEQEIGLASALLLQSYIKKVEQKNALLPLSACGKQHRSTHHIILIAKNHEGLLNLYRLVSYSHLQHMKKTPQIPRSLLMLHREGLIVGSACEAGELFGAVLADEPQQTLERIAGFYDYLEVQPIGNNAFLTREGRVKDDESLRALNTRVVELADKLHLPCVATGDVHFLEPEDSVYREILLTAMEYKDAEFQPPLYFKTTQEMLEEFSYLGEEKALEIVVENPNRIAELCEAMPPFLDEKRTYAPTIDGAEQELRQMAESRAHELYGDPLPEVVAARLKRELDSIIGNGYASLYLMAQRLVKKSLDDGYLVGSRGSVGSSFVANMAGITEVNALQPHYVCPNCRHSEFDVDRSKYACGIDMPDKNCPVCGAKYNKLGYEIPFEVFLGFKGDKTPDIDLNFSGDYQPVAHRFTEVMFGKGHAFRAGTISGVKDKTVYGYVLKYCEHKGISITKDEMDRLVMGCEGVKRTTGQHPGGIVIVPAENDIMEFTPIQYAAGKADGVVTTHFDFHAMDDRLVKLDILGHDDPTALRMLQTLTGLDPRTIPLDDPETMKLFCTSEPLGVDLSALDCEVGSIAIPEFGTGFVRQMLMDTRPTTMEELVRISGLSHGTDVWVGNAQELVRGGVATLSDVICTRDDIMNYLIAKGGDSALSFKTMESVRKGKGLTPEMEEAMRKINVPDWFVDSCKKIKYMFPRAHAAAYVMMAFRVAYYKVHYPAEFYSVYYTVRADAFDIAFAAGGAEKVLQNIKELKRQGNKLEQKEEDLLVILEVVYEMNLRGIELLPVDLYKSQATRFVIEDGALRPPFAAVAGVGANAAEGIAAGASGGEYASIEDFKARTKANSGVVKALLENGCLSGLPETNQISLFGNIS